MDLFLTFDPVETMSMGKDRSKRCDAVRRPEGIFPYIGASSFVTLMALVYYKGPSPNVFTAVRRPLVNLLGSERSFTMLGHVVVWIHVAQGVGVLADIVLSGKRIDTTAILWTLQTVLFGYSSLQMWLRVR